MKRKRGPEAAPNPPAEQEAITPVRKSARTRKTRAQYDDSGSGDAESSDDYREETIALGTSTKQRNKRGRVVATPTKGKPNINGVGSRALKSRAEAEYAENSENDPGAEDDIEELAGSSEDLDEQDGRNEAPSGARRGRPKGRRKRERTPTPPRTLPPHEHYFFQNRPGGNKTSDNTLSSVSLLSHEEYFDIMKNYKDPHRREVHFLHDLHGDSFDQWLFVLEEGFNVCLYGWGSKRKLLMNFADHAASEDSKLKIVILNGYMPGTSVRDLLGALGSAIPGLKDAKIPANPSDALNMVMAALKDEISTRYLLLVHNLDAPSLRRPPTQSMLARLAGHPAISLVSTCDTPNFPVLWDNSMRTQFNWVFHDATTFASFDAEVGGGVLAAGDDDNLTGYTSGGVVDVVNSLLGRSGRKVHGREGVAFVLRSLTESARRLYGLLVAEVLSADEGMDEPHVNGEAHIDVNEFEGLTSETPTKGKAKHTQSASLGTSGVSLEYRALYRKAVQSLIATSEMQFRQLLKEFYDHEMLISKKDTMGTELLSLPFRREELESILEEVELDG